MGTDSNDVGAQEDQDISAHLERIEEDIEATYGGEEVYSCEISV